MIKGIRNIFIAATVIGLIIGIFAMLFTPDNVLLHKTVLNSFEIGEETYNIEYMTFDVKSWIENLNDYRANLTWIDDPFNNPNYQFVTGADIFYCIAKNFQTLANWLLVFPANIILLPLKGNMELIRFFTVLGGVNNDTNWLNDILNSLNNLQIPPISII